MNGLVLWALVLVSLATLPRNGYGQNPDVAARLRPAIVRVEGQSPGGGSGIIVMVNENVARVITALHVVVGSGPRKDRQAVASHDCIAAKPEVEFQLDVNFKQMATACMGSDQDDLALLEVPIPTDIGNMIPSFRKPQADLQSALNYVSFLARNNGSGGGQIVENDATPSSPEGRRFRTVGTNAQPGFSGGAVIDQAGGLTGMVLSSGSTTTSLRWQRIENILDEWGARPTLEPSTVHSDDTFSDNTPQPSLNQGARNAIREYRHVLNTKDAEALARLYQSPKVPRARIDALFGDAVSVSLSLQNCNNLNLSSNTITCEYQLEIVRRTGPSRPYSSTCFKKPKTCVPDDTRLVFTLEQQATGRWTILDVSEARNAAAPRR